MRERAKSAPVALDMSNAQHRGAGRYHGDPKSDFEAAQPATPGMMTADAGCRHASLQ
jgi:hypothetical protein